MNKIENLVSAWDKYFFHNGENLDEEELIAYEIEGPFFGSYTVYENVVDDINEYRFSGTLEECVTYCEEHGTYNYDPLAQWR